MDFSKFKVVTTTDTIKTKEGKELIFLVFSLIINNVPLELTRVIYDSKLESIFNLANSLQVK